MLRTRQANTPGTASLPVVTTRGYDPPPSSSFPPQLESKKYSRNGTKPFKWLVLFVILACVAFFTSKKVRTLGEGRIALENLMDDMKTHATQLQSELYFDHSEIDAMKKEKEEIERLHQTIEEDLKKKAEELSLELALKQKEIDAMKEESGKSDQTMDDELKAKADQLTSELALKQKEIDAMKVDKEKSEKLHQTKQEYFMRRAERAISDLALKEKEIKTVMKEKLENGNSVATVVDPASANRQKHVVNYAIEPDKSTQIVADCITDERCHVQQFHTPKTGGTTIETKFGILNGSTIKCCSPEEIDTFQQDVTPLCDKKYNSYTITPGQFVTDIALPGCQKYYNTIGHRLIVLVPFRAPIERSLSAVHQRCNKAFETRDKETQERCTRCDFNADKEQWMEFVTRTNLWYQDELYDRMIVGTSDDGFPVLTVDTIDMSAFFGGLQEKLPTEIGRKLVEDEGGAVRNGETLDVCDFGFHSELMRALSPAIGVYRNLTLGW